MIYTSLGHFGFKDFLLRGYDGMTYDARSGKESDISMGINCIASERDFSVIA